MPTMRDVAENVEAVEEKGPACDTIGEMSG